MKLSTKGKYGLYAMYYLASQAGEGPQPCLLFLVFCSDPPAPGEISCSALPGSCFHSQAQDCQVG